MFDNVEYIGVYWIWNPLFQGFNISQKERASNPSHFRNMKFESSHKKMQKYSLLYHDRGCELCPTILCFKNVVYEIKEPPCMDCYQLQCPPNIGMNNVSHM